MREHIVVSSIRSRDGACIQRSNIRCLEHFLSVSISSMSVAIVKRSGICAFPQWRIGAVHNVRLAGYDRCEQHLGEGGSGDASRDSIESGALSFFI
jgi:hypothetical protein